ncbi:polyphosphate:AMP phosphotransferase [Pigmentiphaga sp. NML080357]|uniref:polyphosphate:AMP phosphotransferase n=1 Tax=Pigmentiphaga sp. NML080357 TaxID=2008675 RepID=UPI000B4200D3|nr:polyphosphate:AMP phosphotransferase [Pigmentiphaga sp. NML080357]OVZ57650.1 polyphosphate:AMP phosphotransferase [Pigmentiphaga sp. NML080357]
MFQRAELDPFMDEEEYERREPALRTALVQRQYELLKKRDRAVLIVVAGVDGAGKGSAINLLNEWMDPRHIRTLAFGEPTADEAQRPAMWRYWNALPALGQAGIVFGSWYAPLFKEAARKRPDMDHIEAMAAEIRRFEAMLASERVRIVKLWYHLSRAAQVARIDAQLADPGTAWRVSEADLKVRKKFDRLRAAGQIVLEATHAGHAPWHVVPSADPRLRAVETASATLEALAGPLPAPARPAARPARRVGHGGTRLEPPPGGGKLDEDDYEKRLASLQAQLSAHVRRKRFGERSLVLVFEGVDAAGKGGAIRRVSHALDVRDFEIVPISAPSDEELAHPYLWRFWRRLPLHGRVSIFDRSWYGRVLVERVESLIPSATWLRAYGEINDFEEQLRRSGAVVLKFWLSISRDEQLRRFRERRDSPFKSFKLTADDWRNRRKWDDYMLAAREMLARTDTAHAPWVVVATDDKRTARIKVLEHIVKALDDAR